MDYSERISTLRDDLYLVCNPGTQRLPGRHPVTKTPGYHLEPTKSLLDMKLDYSIALVALLATLPSTNADPDPVRQSERSANKALNVCTDIG